MDPRRFDALVQTFGAATSRRGALAAFVVAFVAPLLPDGTGAKRGRKRGPANGKGNENGKGKDRKRGQGRAGNRDKGQNRGKGKERRKANDRNQQTAKPAQAEAACYTGTNCAPGPGKNLSKCDYSGSPALKGKNLKGANLGGATVARGDASGANLQGANLDKTCLVDATLLDALVNSSTNMGTAILCRTTMPDGSTSNAGCNKGTGCCPTCDAAHPCPSGQVCCGGRCRSGDCCTDAHCPDPTKPICVNFTCAPCTTHQQCGNGKRCCNGQCKSGVCCTATDCADRSCQRKDCQSNQCVYTVAVGTACNDGNTCTSDDVCQDDGSCRGTANDCSGQSDSCNDGICRASDGACVKRPKADGGACNDGNLCTVNDVCQNGACRGTAKDCSAESDVCNDGGCRAADGACIKQPKRDGIECNADNTSCTVGDSCQNGECTPGAGVDCSEQDDQCNTGVCDTSTGSCIKDPDPGRACEHPDLCIAGGTCDANGTCGGGSPRICPVCMTCRGSDGACQPVATDARCETTCCNGTCCDAGEQCVGTTCQAACAPGTDCSGLDDQCNDGVCDPTTGGCIKRRKDNGTACSATGSACTEGDSCQGGTCVAGPAVVCGASDECHVAGVCNPATGVCSNPNAADGTPCGDRGSCEGGACIEPCLGLNAVCDEATDVCCDSEGEVCSPSAFCAALGDPGRCCRDEGRICSRDCDCCEGVCAGGICCRPGRQCGDSSDCCAGQSCMGADPGPGTCTPTCGTQHSFCGAGGFPCCAGFECVNEECWPEFCQAPTQTCQNSTECCEDFSTIDCQTTVDSGGANVCCRPFNEACQHTDECCNAHVCGPQSTCCRGGFFDPDRGGEQARGCIGRENECCRGRRCNRFSNVCCLAEGQPVNPASVVDCCHFTAENGVCSCHTDGETCGAPSGNPANSSCCDGQFCVQGKCEPACNQFFGSPCGSPGQLPCCRSLTCRAGVCQ